jgi:hypothetical protein
VDLSLTERAEYAGAYQAPGCCEILRYFGWEQAGEPLQVRINAVQLSVPGQFEYDLAANYCAAFWQSAAGARPCPGNSADAGGLVILVDRPAMENGRPNEPGLWVRPNQDRSGWLSAQYPAYTVARGDHFLAEAGCLANSPGCNLVFQLDYRSLDGFSGRGQLARRLRRAGQLDRC